MPAVNCAVLPLEQKELLDAGVKIYEFTPGLIHSKTMVSDDDTAVVGTMFVRPIDPQMKLDELISGAYARIAYNNHF